MNDTARLAELEARAAADSALLKAASSNSDDWDDATWAAWWRTAERAQDARKERVTQLEADNKELRAELNRLRDENAAYEKALTPGATA